jgi:hypothetical protein
MKILKVKVCTYNSRKRTAHFVIPAPHYCIFSLRVSLYCIGTKSETVLG